MIAVTALMVRPFDSCIGQRWFASFRSSEGRRHRCGHEHQRSRRRRTAAKMDGEHLGETSTAATTTRSCGHRHHRRSLSSPFSESSEALSCSSSSHPLSSEQGTLSLSAILTNQRWHEVGNGPFPIAATDDFDVMVDQLSSILGFRLLELLINRVTFPQRSMTLSNRHNKFNGNGGGGRGGGSELLAMEYLRLDLQLGDYVLAESITTSIREYVSCIGKMHNDVGFHSFEHATHVTISMNKLLSMVTTVDNFSNVTCKRRISAYDSSSRRESSESSSSEPGLYDRQRAERISFGISEDARIRFALVFSALIHDVGHKGVPNSVLVEEEDELAILHNDVSVAEQNSLQVAFSLLQQDQFQELKHCIGHTPEERKFFRKKVIQMVMATDISDQERLQIVTSRWNAAFPPEQQKEMQEEKKKKGAGVIQSQELKQAMELRRYSMFSSGAAAEEFASERKLQRLGIRHSMDLSGMLLDAYPTSDSLQQHAVLEAMMNVADVAHTMQSFQVFVKWNRRLFKELYRAHLNKRIAFDPSDNWYENQIGFFSHYIIPLSQKMKTCGVFGATGTVFEYFAMENRKRWLLEGQEVSEEIIDEVKKEIRKEGLSAS